MEAERRSVKNSLIMKEVEILLAEQKNVSIYVRGGSMRPFLREGDKVTLIPACEQNVRKGMIVLARTSRGMVLHRVVKVRSNGEVLLAGDANAWQRELAEMGEVWGVVSDAYRQGRELELYSCRMYTAVCIWNLLRPLRGGLLKICEWWYKKR